MGDGAENMEDQLAVGRRRVDLLLQAHQVYLPLADNLLGFEQFCPWPTEPSRRIMTSVVPARVQGRRKS